MLIYNYYLTSHNKLKKMMMKIFLEMIPPLMTILNRNNKIKINKKKNNQILKIIIMISLSKII